MESNFSEKLIENVSSKYIFTLTDKINARLPLRTGRAPYGLRWTESVNFIEVIPLQMSERTGLSELQKRSPS